MRLIQDLSSLTDSKTSKDRAQKALDGIKKRLSGKRFISLRDKCNPTAIIEVEIEKYKRRMAHYAEHEAINEGIWE